MKISYIAAFGAAFLLPTVAYAQLTPGGGGSGGTFTWPGTAGNGTGAASTGGTMPYVNAYIVNGSGGGGLSVTDQAPFTAGTSAFTPGGGQYNATQQSLTSGQSGMEALSPIRSQYVDTQTTNNNLYAAVTAPIPAQTSHGVNIGGVEGLAASGSAIVGDPVLIGGSDGTNARSILTSTTGHVVIDCGSAGGSCGGSGGTASTYGASFPTTGTAAGAEYLSSAPTLTSGQMVALQTTVNGSLHTTVDNTNANGSALSASSSPVVIASDQSAVSTKVPLGAIAAGASAGDPCMYGTKINLPISTNATALTQIVALSGSTKIYICSINLVAPAATAFNLVGGTGTNCAAAAVAIMGSTTAANGMSWAANGGFTLGNGSGVIAVGPAGSELCTLQSNAVQVAGNLTYVQQ